MSELRCQSLNQIRKWIQALGTAGILLAMTGCGGGDESESAGAGSPATTTPPAAAAGGGGAAAPSAPMAPPEDDYAPPGVEGVAGGGGAAPSGPRGLMPPEDGPMGMDDGAMLGQSMPGGMGASMGANLPPRTARSTNFSAWTDKDFHDAVRERDPVVLKAIDDRVKSKPGDTKVAELLTALIVTSTEPPVSVDMTMGSGAGNGMGMNPGMSSSGMAPGMAPGMMGMGMVPGKGRSSAPGMGGVPSSSGGMAPGQVPSSSGGMAPGQVPSSSGGMAPGQVPSSSGGMAPGQVPSSSGGMAPGSGPSSSQRGSLGPPGETQSRLDQHPRSLAVDSLELMLAEAATAYLQQGAVGAMRGRLMPAAPGSGPPGGADSSLPGADRSMPGGGAMSAPSDSSMGLSSGAMGSGMSSGMQSGMAGGGAFGGASGANAGGGGGGLDVQRLTENIVGNLIRNDSSVAWQSIHGISSGAIQTAVEGSGAAEIVAKSLLRNLDSGSSQTEPILLAVLNGKAQLPPESQSAFARVMAAVSNNAADKLTGFGAAAAAAPAGGGMAGGMAGMGLGMSAPGMGMSSAPGMGVPGSGMGGLPGRGGPPGMGGMAAPAEGEMGDEDYAPPGDENGLGGGGAMAPAESGGFGGGFGGAAAAVGVGSSNRPIVSLNFSQAELTRAAKFIWGPKSVDAVVQKLRDAGDPIAAADFLLLASSIPNQKTREATYAAFARSHSLGAEVIRNTGVFDGVHDPGMLVILKTLPRQKPAKDEAQNLDSWTQVSQEQVLGLRDRLRAMSAQGGRLQAVKGTFPVRLHKNAVPEFSGMMVLPGTQGATMKESAPSETKIYYARTTFTPQRPKDQDELRSHYESRASGFARPDQSKGLLWVDGVKGGTSGVRRTMDVIIQSAGGGGGAAQGMGAARGFGAPGMEGGGGGGASGSFTVEIIVVETSDPKGSSTAAVETAPARK